MTHRTKKTISFLSFLLALALGAFVLRAALAGDSDAEPLDPSFTMDSGVEILLLRMGLSPQEFAAAGASGATMQTALATEEDTLEVAVVTLARHDEDCAEAQVTSDALFRRIERRRATQEEIDQYPSSKQAFDAAIASRATFLDGVAADLFQNLSHGQGTALAQLRDNQRWKHLPAQYRVEERTDAQWVEVKDALAAKRTHDDMGDETPQEVLNFLSTLNSGGDVSTAAANIDTNFAGVQAAWDSIFAH